MSSFDILPIALTCGEPAGIGPEIAARAWEEIGSRLPFFLIGDPSHLPKGTPVREIGHPREAERAAMHGLPVLPHPFDGPAIPGNPDPRNARSVIDVISRAVQLVQAGEAGAVCTAPISKKALQDGAGFAFPGHTEYLAHLAGVSRVVMMLACPDLRVVPATIHIPLAEVPQQLTRRLLTETIQITHNALRQDFGIGAPRIAIAGLNPHAGEGGAMGREEIETILPVIESFRSEGYSLAGPLAGDTMFHPAARAKYDAAICMYHDQALIPIKTIDFAHGVNVTLGLPFIRTSPDHGTAFDIAGKGVADPASLIAALEMAAELSPDPPDVSAIDGLPPLREVIAEYGLSARKQLGQNFLLDLNLTAKIARSAGDLTGADVLEVGPGPGGLTRGLLAEGARHVLAIEKDPRCIPALEEIAAHYPGRLDLVEGDALTVDLTGRLTPPIRIVANLPYNVGTELLVRWLTPPQWPPFWQSLTLMFQKEVAERIVAKPGSPAYGRLALLAQWRTEARIVMTLPPDAFTPPPKVHSSVVHLVARAEPAYPADPAILSRVVAAAFNQRRKMLRSSLKGLAPDIEDRLLSVGIKPTERAEQLSLEQFCALSRTFG